MIGEYDHLNAGTPIRIKAGSGLEVNLAGEGAMEALVAAVRQSNYGAHRFMSEFVRQVRREYDDTYGGHRSLQSRLAKAIAAVLEEQ